MGVFCGPMKHETRSTPETLAFFLNTKGDPLDKYWSAIAKCEQLERERDEAREELARLQTMAASVADVIAKRDAMLESIEAAHLELSYALGTNLGVVKNHVQKALAKLKPFLP